MLGVFDVVSSRPGPASQTIPSSLFKPTRITHLILYVCLCSSDGGTHVKRLTIHIFIFSCYI